MDRINEDEKKRRDKVESISDAEWQITRVLWAKSPLTAADIIGEIRSVTGWSPKTIHTLIRRLVQKGVIAAKDGVTPFTYYPLLSEAECERGKTCSLVDKIYNGSFNLMVARFVKDDMLSKEEIDELKKILGGK